MSQAEMHDTKVVIDAHVHFYDCFDPCVFLNAAHSNLSSSAGDGQNKGLDETAAVKVLLLTETSREDAFQRLTAASKGSGQAFCSDGESWYSNATDEATALRLESDTGKELYIIAGRQIVCKEGLEIHALATDSQFAEGLPLRQLIEEINSSGAVAAMPWGAGKWLGQRGSLMADMSEYFAGKGVLLSDSGIRPWIWSKSKLFNGRLSEIAGTDPLPIASEASRVGSVGLSVMAAWQPARPAASIRTVLKSRPLQSDSIGRQQGVWQFLARQVAIRI